MKNILPSLPQNSTTTEILRGMLIAAVSLFLNGLGVYLTIHAAIGVGPWDVLNIGLSKTLGILYGNASITVGFIILGIDILLREPIGIAMIIDTLVVGKAVDFFNWIDVVPVPGTLVGSIIMMIIGLFIMGYTQYGYMWASLGCGPRDTLLVGLKRHAGRFPIGGVSIVLLSLVTLIGWLLGGPVGIGTIICAFLAGPIMQFAFWTVGFVPTEVKHQNILKSFRIIFGKTK
jgi:uncharacterized membrane protein YczE